MSSSSRRSYYDPKQPRLLSSEEIAALTPTECSVACLQIDQILVGILQNIDADFGRSHRIITGKILPDLERYGQASKGIWEGFKFWQEFFEASVSVKLSGDHEESEPGPSTNETSQQEHQEDDSSTDTIQQDRVKDVQSGIKFDNLKSPFETLKQDLHHNLGISPKTDRPSSDEPQAESLNDSHQTSPSASLQKPPHWHDLSMDSPDTTLQMPIPQDLSLLIDAQSGNSLDSDLSISSFVPGGEHALEEKNFAASSQLHDRKGATQGSKILLHQALLRDTMSGNHKRQTISTPAKVRSRSSYVSRGSLAGGLPPEVTDPGWNGLTDLRKVPLDGLVGTKMSLRKFRVGDDRTGKGPSDDHTGDEPEESLRAGISPPQTIHFAVPMSRLAQTPSKEAARLMTRDVLETARLKAGYANPMDLEDSPPLEPPSVLREWKQRGYESLYQSRGDVDLQQNNSNSLSFGMGQPDRAQPGPSREASVSRALIDLREGDISSGRPSHNFPKPSSQRDDPFSENPSARSRETRLSAPSARGQLSAIPTDEFDHSTDSLPDSPTVFGIRHQPKPSLNHPIRRSDPHHNPNPERASQPFVPMRPDEMDTFFGGNLLESECFEPSPLQGKRMKYTDPKKN